MNDKKRLYKIKDQSMISGVCAGVGEYFDIDVSIVRLVWIGLAFIYFVGVIVYIAAAIVLPDKKDLIKKDPNFNKPFEDVDYHESKKNYTENDFK